MKKEINVQKQIEEIEERIFLIEMSDRLTQRQEEILDNLQKELQELKETIKE